MSSPDNIDLLRKDFSALGDQVARLVIRIGDHDKEIAELKMQSAVRDERDKAVREHLARIDTALGDIRSIGRYFLFAFSSSIIGAFVLFIVRGGMNVSP